MRKLLYVSAAAAALAFAGGAQAAGHGGSGGHAGGMAGGHIGGAAGAHISVGAGTGHGIGATVSGAAKSGGGAAAVLPNTRASDEGIEYGSAAKTKAKANADDDHDGVLNKDDTDDDNDGVLDANETHANNGVGTAVSAAARSGSGAAAVLPNTRASANGIEHGSASATHHGTDTTATVSTRGHKKGDVTLSTKVDSDGDGVVNARDIDDDNDGVLDINDDQPTTHANNGVGAAVSAAAKSGGGAAAVLPNTRASDEGIEYGSESADHNGTNTTTTPGNDDND